jgi:peptidoglycan hydrolase-like protein with peptidoglycan-binding domain
MREHIRALQAALKGLGFDPGPVDGISGPRTRAAALAFGQPRPVATPAPVPVAPVAAPEPPWMVEARRVLGRHETRDHGWLSKWLRSDGRTLGDPAKLPWCGDFVETCIRLGLPDEPFAGDLARNP